jgi:hypothetical protein
MVTALYMILFQPLDGTFGDVVYFLILAAEVGVIEFPLWNYFFIERKSKKKYASANQLRKLEKKH